MATKEVEFATKRAIIRLRLALLAGVAEMKTLKDDLVSKLKEASGGEDDEKNKAACKAFETLYRKSGAMEAAANSGKSVSSKVCYSEVASFTKFRETLGVIGGSFRESPEVVLGKVGLSDKERVANAIAAIEDQFVVLSASAVTSDADYEPAKLKQYGG